MANHSSLTTPYCRPCGRCKIFFCYRLCISAQYWCKSQQRRGKSRIQTGSVKFAIDTIERLQSQAEFIGIFLRSSHQANPLLDDIHRTKNMPAIPLMSPRHSPLLSVPHLLLPIPVLWITWPCQHAILVWCMACYVLLQWSISLMWMSKIINSLILLSSRISRRKAVAVRNWKYLLNNTCNFFLFYFFYNVLLLCIVLFIIMMRHFDKHMLTFLDLYHVCPKKKIT